MSGTHGAARLGYLNIPEVINGKEIRSIATDSERVELVQLGFEAFATGEYSVTTLRDMLEEVGLRTRPTEKRPAKPLSRNGVYRMLRDDYYIGIVTRGGAKREGRHEAIIDPAIFEKVQRTLEAHRLSGDRIRSTPTTSRARSAASATTVAVQAVVSGTCRDAVERAIERYYRMIELTSAESDAVRRDLKEQIGVRLEVARKQSQRHERKLRELQNEQQKLLQLFYKGGVDEEVLQAEQQRI